MTSLKQAQTFRKQLSKKAMMSLVMVLAILALIQLIALRHNVRIDMTRNQRHTLSPQSKKILENLQSDINAHAFFTEDDIGFPVVKNLLDQYSHESKHFHYDFIDQDREPQVARKYGATKYYPVVVLEQEDRHLTVATDDPENIPSEFDFTNTLIKLTRGEKKKIIYVTGLHGEIDFADMSLPGSGNVQSRLGAGILKSRLETLNYDILPLNLAQDTSVPSDADIVIIAGPEVEFLETEINMLRNYIENGGNLLAL
ncbi:GldG family protein, partial [bacterium]|nr:GldG family protein [candidate division CSSED10-310 bacterium]